MRLCAVEWCACYAREGSALCAGHVFWKGDINTISQLSRPEQPEFIGEGEKYFRQHDTEAKQQKGAAKGAKVDCKSCHGSGECPHCKGDGQVLCECSCGDTHDRDCPECDGDGECPRCFNR